MWSTHGYLPKEIPATATTIPPRCLNTSLHIPPHHLHIHSAIFTVLAQDSKWMKATLFYTELPYLL